MIRPDPDRDHVVPLRCPGCGPVDMEVLAFDREGVTAVRCPECEETFEAFQRIGLDRMREASPFLPGSTILTKMTEEGGDDDDGA